jgi:hypothetical protein
VTRPVAVPLIASHLRQNTTALKGETGIKFVAHLRRLGRKSYAVEQLTCLFSRNGAVDVKALKCPAALPSPPQWRGVRWGFNFQAGQPQDNWRKLAASPPGQCPRNQGVVFWRK